MLRLRRYERILVENQRFCSNGGRLTLNFRQKGSPPTNHSFSQKTRLNWLSYGVKMWTDLSSVLSQCTRVMEGQTDGQTDRILIAIPRLHYMQRGKNRLRLSKVIVKNKMSRFFVVQCVYVRSSIGRYIKIKFYEIIIQTYNCLLYQYSCNLTTI